MTFTADYFDGLSARHSQVTVRVAADLKQLSFAVNNETLIYDFADIELQAKLGSAKRLIDLPNGAKLEAADISELEAAMPSHTSTFWRGLHYLENHLGWVLASVIATVFAGWLFLQFGVPKLAEKVANATPLAIEAKIGEQVLIGLDSRIGYFSPSQTDLKRKTDVVNGLNKLCDTIKTCPQYRLEWRKGGMIGANAFALPGGIMVVTDELIKLAKNDDEIISVLAHELGHVKQRHAFRQSLQGVLAGLILASITGDVSSVASGLPAVLIQMQYSREHELLADNFALKALQKACIAPKVFADILQRLHSQGEEKIDNQLPKKNEPNNQAPEKAKQEGKSTSNESNISQLLSSHPNTLERIKPFLQADQNCKS